MLMKLALSAVPITLFGYLANKFYFSGGVCKSNKRLDGKICIVTGSNTGIGYETAFDLAKRGAHVIMACRDLDKAQRAADKIILETNNNRVEIEQLDLGNLRSIREFALRIKNRFKRLDILVNNAGVYSLDNVRHETKDGFELMFGVNHLGPFLLTNLLLDLLISSGPSRIVNVSSLAHYKGKIDWNNIDLKNNYESRPAYARSKLANVLFTKQLAKKLESTNVTTYSLHPGVVRTEIFRDLFTEKFSIYSLVYFLLLPLFYMLLKTCKEGAQTTLHCCLDEEATKYTGQYFSDCKCIPMSKIGEDAETAERLWKLSSSMVGLEEERT